MFILSTIEDTLFIPGGSFNHTSHPSQPATSATAVAHAINAKYANRVIPDVGLCISLFDMLEVSEGRVKWGDGGLWHTVKARLAVFRPFVGEVLVGKVMSSDEHGIRVSMGFFDDIHIPKHLMPEPSAFDHQERAFFWVFSPSDQRFYDDPILAPAEERMYLDRDELIRFAIEDDIFEEAEPIPGLAATGAALSGGGASSLGGVGGVSSSTSSAAAAGKKPGDKGMSGSGQISQGVTVEAIEAAKAKRRAPFRITGSIAGQGLGLVRWWMGASGYEGEEVVDGGDQAEEVMDLQ